MKKMPELTGHVVSHTHWDRAWYWTFEQTRVRLLDLMDDLLELMEQNPSYRHFVLDGQLAMVEDYLALRPERALSVKRLVDAGRLLLGPFLVLPDLFIPSGESLVRNLRAGQRAASSLGPVMKLGYLPDPFGHPSQIPQVLRGFGIDGVMMSRGLGDEGEDLGADFTWEAPDGSQVLATHQVGGGYCNLSRLGREGDGESRAENAARAVERLVARMSPRCKSGHLLLNNGCDHLPAQPELPGLLTAVNRRIPDIRLKHSTPLAYQRAVRRAVDAGRFKPKIHRGELRGCRYHNLLPGVLSARVDLKLRHHACETLLLRWAEPFAALARSLGLGRDDRALLDHAWRELLLCQPHDDICGCSIDPVHEDDLSRMAHAAQVARLVRDRALEAVACRAAAGSDPVSVVFNPHPWRSPAVVQVGKKAGHLAGPDGPLPEQAGEDHSLIQIPELPAMGYLTLSSTAAAPPRPADPVKLRRGKRGITIENSQVRVQINPDASLLRLQDRKSGLTWTRVAELVDDGDAGDTYDFAPPPRQRTVRGADRPARPRVLEAGPLRAAVTLRSSLLLPASLGPDRRARSKQTRRLPYELLIQLTAASPVVEIELTVDNTVVDHRLRFALQAPSARDVIAGAPFIVERRRLATPDRPGWFQAPAATLPFSDFVALEDRRGGLAVLAPGLHEVEGQPHGGGTRLLLTLLRSVGWLSRDDLSTRDGEAGPCLPVQGALQLGKTAFRLGLLPYSGGWGEAGVARRCQEHAAPPRIIQPAERRAELPPRMETLRLSPASVQLTSLIPGEDGMQEVRIVNLERRPVEACMIGAYRAHVVRLDGRLLPGKVDLDRIPLGPGEILTLRLQRI